MSKRFLRSSFGQSTPEANTAAMVLTGLKFTQGHSDKSFTVVKTIDLFDGLVPPFALHRMTPPGFTISGDLQMVNPTRRVFDNMVNFALRAKIDF